MDSVLGRFAFNVSAYRRSFLIRLMVGLHDHYLRATGGLTISRPWAWTRAVSAL